MRSRQQILTVLSLILAILLPATASASPFDRAKRGILLFDRSLKTKKAKEFPAFRCFYLGRLQGSADRLIVEATIDEKRGLNKATVQDLKAAHQLMQDYIDSFNDALSCDSQLASRLAQLNPPGVTILGQVQLAVASTSTISAQDQIVGCFIYGRLSALQNELDAMIKHNLRHGKPVPKRAVELRDLARAKTLREMPDCKVTPSGGQGLDI